MPHPLQDSLPARWLPRLASPWLALVFFLLAAGCSLAATYGLAPATALMAVPFALLGINLGASIAIHPRFRTDLPLLLFHLALLALVLLFVLGRLTYFDGYALLTRGDAFVGDFDREAHGPLHGERYREISFANEGFTEPDPDGPYQATVNRIRWLDGSGRWLPAEISNDRPLILGGYRIYPTKFRGYSPMLTWQPASGPEEHGIVHLPPAWKTEEEFPKGVSWQISNGPELWAMVRVQRSQRAPGPLTNLGAETLEHLLIVWAGDARHELRPGDSVALAGGRLTYVALDAWLGYRIVHDETESWLAAAILLAIGSLVWFYARRLGRSTARDLE